MVGCIDTAELRLVERVERFKAHFDVRAFMTGELEGLAQCEVEVVEARSADIVLSGSAEALIGAAKPRSERSSIDAGGCAIEPGFLVFRVADCSSQVRTVAASAQAERVSAVV